MLAKLLKPVRELFDIFRKQNTFVKLLIVAAILIIARTIVERLTWGIFSETYIENFGSGADTAFAGAVGAEMVLCHMTTCGHCKKMMPEWDKFAKQGKIKTRKIEVSEDEDFMRQHDVSSFPTILLLDKSGKKLDEYRGERDASSFAEYAAKVQKK